MSVSSWDDYPIHQTAEYIRHPATSDRNFYDRYYFNLHGSSDEVMTIFGLGQYPNLGVTDAFIAVGTKDKHRVIRASRPLHDRSDLKVGPISIEILDPLKSLALDVRRMNGVSIWMSRGLHHTIHSRNLDSTSGERKGSF